MTSYGEVFQRCSCIQATAIGKTSDWWKKTQCITHIFLSKQPASNLLQQHSMLGGHEEAEQAFSLLSGTEVVFL